MVESIIEGREQKAYTTKYERNPKLRKKMIELQRAECRNCGFDFEKTFKK